MEIQGLRLLDTTERCFCPDESLTYECTVMGEPEGTIVWMGSAFNCTSHEISLFHGQHESIIGIYGECGDIMGQSEYIVNATNVDNSTITAPYYISQLTVPINLNRAGRTIECLYDDGATSISVGRVKINITVSK